MAITGGPVTNTSCWHVRDWDSRLRIALRNDVGKEQRMGLKDSSSAKRMEDGDGGKTGYEYESKGKSGKGRE